MGYRNVLEQNNGGTRYSTLNIAPNKTVEFRFFKSPDTYASFVKNLEFVLALLQYFRTGSTSVRPKEGRNYTMFSAYIKSETRSKLEARNPYHYLAAYLKEKGIT
jgi:hypothetical protein